MAVDLSVVTDDGGSGVPGDVAFSAIAVDVDHDGFNDGDLDKDNMLDPGERWLFTRDPGSRRSVRT